MLRGIYAAAAGMITQRERLDVIADNTANVSTVGFKRADPISRGFYQVFADEIARFPGERGSTMIPGGGSALDATSQDFSPGPVIETGNPFDVAIDGPGFFAVRTPAGERYTRAGNFTLDAEGKLVTESGYSVLGQGGPIITSGENVQISQDGDVVVDGVPAERLLLVDFPRPYELVKYGRNLYGVAEDMRRTRTPAEGSLLRVGTLEHSNVNPINELVLMMDAARAYETHQRVVRALDETLDAAVNRIARQT